MARDYFTIITRENDVAPWAPQFGAYDRTVCVDEMRDTYAADYAPRNRRIIKTGARQCEINIAVAALNGRSPSPFDVLEAADKLIVVHVS